MGAWCAEAAQQSLVLAMANAAPQAAGFRALAAAMSVGGVRCGGMEGMGGGMGGGGGRASGGMPGGAMGGGGMGCGCM